VKSISLPDDHSKSIVNVTTYPQGLQAPAEFGDKRAAAPLIRMARTLSLNWLLWVYIRCALALTISYAMYRLSASMVIATDAFMRETASSTSKAFAWHGSQRLLERWWPSNMHSPFALTLPSAMDSKCTLGGFVVAYFARSLLGHLM
jgi:hypothetical protein